MIIKSKLRSIRKYLVKERRVFINNIIITLPANVKVLDTNGDSIDPKRLIRTEHVKIEIPDAFNIIGLIDGQHRVFAYHEGGDNDVEIGKLRLKQNLLATGIIYPNGITDLQKSQFEANLFLEINANQTNAKSDLKQAIGLILDPFSPLSIARALVYRLNTNGPLENKFERFFYEKEKLRRPL